MNFSQFDTFFCIFVHFYLLRVSALLMFTFSAVWFELCCWFDEDKRFKIKDCEFFQSQMSYLSFFCTHICRTFTWCFHRKMSFFFFSCFFSCSFSRLCRFSKHFAFAFAFFSTGFWYIVQTKIDDGGCNDKGKTNKRRENHCHLPKRISRVLHKKRRWK